MLPDRDISHDPQERPPGCEPRRRRRAPDRRDPLVRRGGPWDRFGARSARRCWGWWAGSSASEWGSGLSMTASETSDVTRPGAGRAAAAARAHVDRYLDLVALLAVLPLFLLADLPLAAYLVGGGVWIVQRIIQLLLQRRAEASDDPRIVAGYTAGSMIARGWMCALAIFGVGLAEGDEAGPVRRAARDRALHRVLHRPHDHPADRCGRRAEASDDGGDGTDTRRARRRHAARGPRS